VSATIRIKWQLDVVDRGAGAKVLKEDRAIRAGLIQTDAQYRRTADTAVSVSARQAEASSRVASSTRQAGAAQVAASDEVTRYAAAQRELLSISAKMVEQQDAISAAYVRSGRAARSSAADQSLASRVRSKVSRAGSSVIGAGAAVGGAIRNAASTAGIGVGLAGFAGLAVIAKETIGFDRAMRNVNSIAQLSEKGLQGVNTQIRALAGKTAQAPITLAKGMYDLVSSGFNAKQSLIIVGAAARAATAGLSTTDVSTKAIAAVLNAYHESASKAKAISDTLFQTVNYGVITFGELAEHIGTLLPFSASLGVNLKEDGAAISTLTKQGIRGELAITFLKNAMVAFLKPSKGMVAAIKATGAASGEALVKHRGFEGALNAVIGTTGGSKAAIAKLFPNIRSLTAALGLTGKNAKSAAKDLAGFKNDTGATSKALSQQSQSISYGWNKLKAEASSLAIGLGQKLVPAANKVLGVLTKIGDKKTSLGGAVSSLLDGISAGVSGRETPGPAKPHRIRVGSLASGLAAPRLPGPLALGHQQPFAPATSVSTSEPSTLSKVGAAIGKAARTVGTAAVEAGKQLLDAFKPALPFLQNIVLPLLLGIGKGVLGSVVVAFKVLVPVIKVVATALGWLGTIAKPFKGLIEDLGLVIGFVFSGPILKVLGGLGKLGIIFKVLAVPVRLVTGLFGLAGKAISKLPGLFGLVGAGLTKAGNLFGKLPGKIGSFAGGVLTAAGKLAISAGKGLASLPAKLAVNAYSAGRGVIDKLGEWVGKAGGVAGRILGAIIKPIGSLAGRVAGLADDAIKAFAELGSKIVSAIVNAIKGAPNAIIDAVKSLIPGPLKSVAGSVLGVGESVVKGASKLLGGRRGGRLGPIGFRRYQSGGMVDALVSPGEAIVCGNSTWTVPGPRVAADSVFTTLPLGAAVLTADGQARMGAGASLTEAIAMQAPHFRAGGVVTGKVSTFGPPSEPSGPTASGVSSASRGIAVRPGATWQSGKATLGQYWQVSIGAHTGTLKQIDLGPNQSTGRRIDVTGAGAKYLGIDPKRFPTDSTGTATLLGKSKKDSSTSGVTINLPINLGKSRTRTGLVPDALNQGVEAGAAGLTRGEINRAYRGARGAEANPILAAIQQAQTATTRKVTIGASKKSGGGGLAYPVTKWNPSHLPIANWIVPFLSWGAGHGWGGIVTSGYRSRAEQARIYASGVRPAAKPGTSNHEGKTFPSGAVDVTAAALLSSALSKRPGPHLLQWAGSKDPVHFSYPHNGGYRRGGIVGFRKGGKAQVTLQKRYADVTATLQRLWGVAAPYYHQASSAMPKPTYTTGANAVFVGVDFGSGKHSKHAGHRQLFIPNWIAQGEGKFRGLRGKEPGYLALLLHEWAHEFQDNTALDRAEKLAPKRLVKAIAPMSPAAEGGAQGFANLFGPRIIAKAGFGTFRPSASNDALYHPAVVWANRKLGKRWLANTQFGFRKGGIVRRYRTGGTVGAPGAGHVLNTSLTSALTFKGGSWQKLDEAIGNAAEQRIEALRATIARQVKAGGDKKTIQRLQSVLSLIDFEIGRRIGSFQLAITKRSTSIEHGQSHLERALRKQGVESSSAAGLTAQTVQDKHDQVLREQNVTSGQRALKLAEKTGNRQQITAATEQLTQAQEELDETVTKGIEDSRALIVATSQELVERTSKSIEEARGQLDRNLRKAGIETGSSAALIATIGVDESEVALRTSIVDSVSTALAQSTDPGASSQLFEQLKQARIELDEALTVQVEDQRALIRQAAQEKVETAQFGVDSVQNALSGLDINQRLARTAETPAGEIQKAQAIQAQLLPALRGNLEALNSQLGVLQSTGDSTGARQALLNIQSAGNEIASAMAESADLLRQAAEQAAQETVDHATQRTSLAQLGQQHLELEERIAGTYDAGGQERANYIDNTLIPALNGELAALNAQLTTASKEGDPTLASQIAEAIATKQNDILQATLDATEQVAQNTGERKIGGMLGFTDGNESLSDSIIAVGNGS
jgi:TP901 family phage tail tape measure protein